MNRDGTAGIFTGLPGYAAAVAELPASAKLTDDMRGAVVVVPGAGAGDWWQGMLAAGSRSSSSVPASALMLLLMRSGRGGEARPAWSRLSALHPPQALVASFSTASAGCGPWRGRRWRPGRLPPP
jgi:hypothetical protein